MSHRLRIFLAFLEYSHGNILFLLRLILEQIHRAISGKRHLWHLGNVILDTPFGTFLARSSDDAYACQPYYEPDIHELVEQNHLRYRDDPHRVAINLGAHIGRYAIELAHAYDYRVYTFEANPKTYRTLSVNILLSEVEDRVRAFPFGLSDRADTLRLRDEGGLSRIVDASEGDDTIAIDLRVFDELAIIDDPRHIHLMIIDVEGHEKQVLTGMNRTLDAIESADIIVEIWRDSPDRTEIVDFMTQKGYTARAVGPENWLFQK